MARQPGTLITGKKAYSNMSFAPTVDLSHNGQQGFIPDYRTYLNNSAYVQRNVIPFLIEYPRGFDHLPHSEIYIATLKSLVETHAKTIEGLGGAITVSYVENPVGASGEMQEDYSQTQRARSTPTFTWVERQGRPIHLFFNAWIFNLLGHPDTQTPMINAYRGSKDGDEKANNRDKYFDFLPDFNSMSMLFVEPDPFQRRVVEAWLCVNMMPKGSGDLNGKRDIASAMQSREISIEFTCMTMMSLGVNQFAQTLLDELNYAGLNPQTRRSSIEVVNANIKAPTMPVHYGDGQAVNEGIGYLAQVNDVATHQHYENSGLESNVSETTGTRMQHNPAWILSEGERN